jgi:hypothetical protein
MYGSGWAGSARRARCWRLPPPALIRRPRRWWILPAIAAGIFGAGAGWLLRAPKPVELPLRAYSFTPESLSTTDYVRRAVISPNGKHIAYAAGNKLWIRDLDREQAQPVDGSENAEAPSGPLTALCRLCRRRRSEEGCRRWWNTLCASKASRPLSRGRVESDGLSILFSVGLTGCSKSLQRGGPSNE